MKITITQQIEKGFLGGPKLKTFSGSFSNVDYEITISQCYQREITISTNGGYKETLGIFYSLEALLMLFDGHFFPVVKANDGADITKSWIERSLPSYHSADYMVGTENTLIDFETVLSPALFNEWRILQKELDIVHNMVLYCLSDVQIPIDMKCAFMIEANKGVYEIIQAQKATNAGASSKLPSLKECFLTVAEKYGAEIFKEEFCKNKEEFAKILVNSRNRIAHIKSWQGQRFLNGDESVMCIIKLSLLYRAVLFDLLGITQDTYMRALLSRIQTINAHDTMKKFINSI